MPGRLNNRPPRLNRGVHQYTSSTIQLPSIFDMGTTFTMVMCDTLHYKFCHRAYVLCGHMYYAIILSLSVRRQGEHNKLLAQVAKRAQLYVITCSF